MDEKKVLKKLKIKDFRHLTKSKVIQLASMLDKMDPEVAKKALDQFPDFAEAVKVVVDSNKVVVEAGLDSNNQSTREAYAALNKIIDVLKEQLEKDNLATEERKDILKSLDYVADRIVELDKNNKKFIFNMDKLQVALGAAAIFTLGAALGCIANVNLADDDMDDDDDDAA